MASTPGLYSNIIYGPLVTPPTPTISDYDVARANAGARVRINSLIHAPDAPARSPGPRGSVMSGRIIGFCREQACNISDVVIEPDEDAGWVLTEPGPASLIATGVMELFPVTPPPKRGWAILLRYLKLEPAKPAVLAASANKPAKRVIPDWPHKCPSCGGPALFMSTTIDCKARCR